MGQRKSMVKVLQAWAAAATSERGGRKRVASFKEQQWPRWGVGIEERDWGRCRQLQMARTSPSRCLLLLILGDPSLPWSDSAPPYQAAGWL